VPKYNFQPVDRPRPVMNEPMFSYNSSNRSLVFNIPSRALLWPHVKVANDTVKKAVRFSEGGEENYKVYNFDAKDSRRGLRMHARLNVPSGRYICIDKVNRVFRLVDGR
jgi:hypothetical protein